jgi:sugar diacid utilization regulator
MALTTLRPYQVKPRGRNTAVLQAISTYEHELSKQDAALASISCIYHDDTLARAMRDNVFISTIQSKKQENSISSESLAKNWMIPLERAKRTLQVTTQKGIRGRPNLLTRRFKTNDRMLRYNQLNCTMFSDTLQSSVLSRRQNKYAQVYCVPPNWTKAYTMSARSEAHNTLSSLFHDVGVPDKMVADERLSMLRTLSQKTCWRCVMRKGIRRSYSNTL